MILNVIEHGMTLTDAVRAPRMHHQALPDSLRHEEQGFSARELDRLRRMGHALSPRRAIANVNAVMRIPGGWHGVHEPRGSGGAVGY